MLVDDNQYGAPGNDQFYDVLIEDEDNIIQYETLTLSGPRKYDYSELLEAAMGMFPQYKILKIYTYEIYR